MEKSKRRINPTLLTALAIGKFIVLSACTTAPEAPFHVYNSPLLAAEMQTVEPRERGFDAMGPGDYAPPDRVYVVNERGAGGGRTEEEAAPPRRVVEAAPDRVAQAAPQPADTEEEVNEEERVELPSLMTTRTAKGGHAEEPASARPGPVPGAFSPAAAAEYVWTVYRLNEVELPEAARNDIPALYKACKKNGKIYHASRPVVGDIVFFHNTFDASEDGRNNDWYTHVGIVESVDDNGTSSVLAYQGAKVTRVHLNLEQPEAVEVDGRPANSQLRKPSSDDAPFTQYYAGQLFAGFCSMLGERAELVIVDNWQP